MARAGNGASVRTITRPAPLSREELEARLPTSSEDAIARAKREFRPFLWLIGLTAALVCLAMLAAVFLFVPRQEAIKRNGELAVCIAQLSGQVQYDQIRLLEVEPGPDREALSAELHARRHAREYADAGDTCAR